eukprot:17574-Heterococcus_DN1.PRE.3
MQNHNKIVKSQQNDWVVSGSADSTVRVWTVPVQQYTSNGSVSPPPGRLNALLGLPRTEPVVLQGHVGGVLALEVLRKRRGKEGAVLVLSGGEDKQLQLSHHSSDTISRYHYALADLRQNVRLIASCSVDA